MKIVCNIRRRHTPSTTELIRELTGDFPPQVDAVINSLKAQRKLPEKLPQARLQAMRHSLTNRINLIKDPEIDAFIESIIDEIHAITVR